MNILRHARTALRNWRGKMVRSILSHRVRYHNSSLNCHDTAIWDYGYRDLDAIQLGKNVTVGAHAQIIVYKHALLSSVEGRLVVGDYTVIQSGVGVLAASGEITIGSYTGIGQNSVLVAANHKIAPGKTYLYNPMDETRTGIHIGDNVWIGANCVLLPGTRIGDNTMVAAGAVVRGDVPANEIWGGVPARKLKNLPAGPLSDG
ncbi:MAG: acyltransferase [Alphaproteobacteria bacterium]|nr:acyltransferase [Alphaproteobacteria bacterium]